MVEARFQVYRDIAHKYRFRLRAPNNKIVTVGEAYESKQGCLKGVNAVKKYCNSPIEDLGAHGRGESKQPAPKFQVFKDRNEKYRFHLIAPNYEIIAVSEAYETLAGCHNGINSVKSNCGADIEDLTPSARKAAPLVAAGDASMVKSTATEVEGVVGLDKSVARGVYDVVPSLGEPTAIATGGYTVDSSRDEPKVTGGDVFVVLLDEPQKTAEDGSIVTFTGKLVSGSEGVGGQKINLYESDRSFMQDDFLASGETSDDGSFSITWVAKKMDWWDDTVEVYARYMDDARRLIHIRSETFVIKIN